MAEGSIGSRCSICDDLDANSSCDQWKRMQDGPGHQRIVKYIDLKKAASGGCEICSTVDEGIEAFGDVLEKNETEAQVFFRCQPPLNPLEVGLQKDKNAGNRWLEFFTLTGQPSPWKAFGPANMVPERLDINISVHKIRQWLDECDGHQGCNVYRKDVTTLPTRVLDLGKDPQPLNSIKLYETKGVPGTYMTLSHCWGSKTFISTTEETYEQRIDGIPLADLPQTFRDAVSLTRKLGVQYLWIDSLCIKQDDKKDWEREASKMGSVYSSSFLNIAATCSVAADKGFLKERQVVIAQDPFPSPVRSHKIEGKGLGSGTINVRPLLSPAHRALQRSGYSWNSQLSPLLSRAWVYQERILAPRTVHFHITELLWECNSSSRCECGGLDREQTPIFRPNKFSEDQSTDVERQWFSVVQQYSGLNATRPSDKFPALSGIAEQFQAELKSDYLAGLWRSHILKDLQWVVADGMKCKRMPPYRAPTWSWASLDQQTSMETMHHGTRVTYAFTQSALQDNRLALIDASVSIQGTNPYGAIKTGHLILQAAYLIPTSAEVETEASWVDDDATDSVLLLRFEGYEKRARVDTDIAFSSREPGISPAPYEAGKLRWLMLSSNEIRHYGLLLKPVDGRNDEDQDGYEYEYERVALPCLFSPSPDLIKNAKVAQFRIV